MHRPFSCKAKIVLYLFALVAYPLGTAGASPITLDPVARGCYDSSGAFLCPGSGTPTANYAVGEVFPISASVEIRDFFVFDLSSVTGTVVSAQISFGMSLVGYPFTNPDPSETITFFDYTGSLASLSAGTAGTTGFADLGAGAIYATRAYSAADNGQTVTQTLSAAALADLNLALGASWALGGTMTTYSPAGPGQEIVFANSQQFVGFPRPSQLTLEVLAPTAVPEPASLILFTTGMVGLVYRRRRTRR